MSGGDIGCDGRHCRRVSISLEHKQDNISQIKVIWDDSFAQQIYITFNVSYECNERKIGDWKVTVACYLDLLVNHGRFFMFLFILFRARAEKYFFELRAVHLRAWHNK
jgi:hypothetical protein